MPCIHACFSIIFIAVLLLDAALYHSMYTDMQASFHEVGEARLAWIEQSLQRYVDITEIMEGRVVEKRGRPCRIRPNWRTL